MNRTEDMAAGASADTNVPGLERTAYRLERNRTTRLRTPSERRRGSAHAGEL